MNKMHVIGFIDINRHFVTFSLPSIIVVKLYNTWKTAKKKMRMCN